MIPICGSSSRRERNLSIYFPTMSFSRLTTSPAFLSDSVVAPAVCGIIDTEKLWLSILATVRLIPSMATEPFSTVSYTHLTLPTICSV